MSGSVGATKKNHVTAGTLMQAHARSGGRQGMTSAQTSNAGTPNAKLAHCRMRHPCSARNQQTNQSNRCGLTQSEILVVAFSMTADGLLLRARLSATNQKYKLSVGVRKTIMAGSAVTKPKLTRPDAEPRNSRNQNTRRKHLVALMRQMSSAQQIIIPQSTPLVLN
jgi:hypothetical protein